MVGIFYWIAWITLILGIVSMILSGIYIIESRKRENQILASEKTIEWDDEKKVWREGK